MDSDVWPALTHAVQSTLHLLKATPWHNSPAYSRKYFYQATCSLQLNSTDSLVGAALEYSDHLKKIYISKAKNFFLREKWGQRHKSATSSVCAQILTSITTNWDNEHGWQLTVQAMFKVWFRSKSYLSFYQHYRAIICASAWSLNLRTCHYTCTVFGSERSNWIF